MRILHVTHNYPRHPGDAAGSFVACLARAQVAAGHEVRVLAPHAAGLALRETMEGVAVTRFRYAPDSAETLAYSGTMAEQVRASVGGKARLVGLLRAAAAATAHARRSAAVDIVHAHWWFPAGLALTLPGARGGVPLVTTLHGSDVRLARGRLARALLQRVARVSGGLAAVSAWLADEAVPLAGRPVAVAPMPVAADLFTPGGVRARDRLLFVGRLNAQKGLPVLLAALARLGPGLTLDVVGDGPDAAAVRDLAVQLGVAPRVRWHPPVPQPALADWYRRATALVLPATAPEGLGLTAAEALLCGCPVVASATGGLRELVDDATGYPVPPGDPAALAGALVACCDAPDAAQARASAGAMRVRETLAPTVCVARYDALYAEARRGA